MESQQSIMMPRQLRSNTLDCKSFTRLLIHYCGPSASISLLILDPRVPILPLPHSPLPLLSVQSLASTSVLLLVEAASEEFVKAATEEFAEAKLPPNGRERPSP